MASVRKSKRKRKVKNDKDFLQWNHKDIDFNSNLGSDYTHSELSSDSEAWFSDSKEDEVSEKSSEKSSTKRKPDPKPPSSNDKVYQGPECHKLLKTIVGFRGHVMKQHKLSNIRGKETYLDFFHQIITTYLDILSTSCTN